MAMRAYSLNEGAKRQVGGRMREGPSCQPRAIRMSRRAIMEEARKTAQLHTALPCLCHPGLDPGSRSATSQRGTPDQVRGAAGRVAGRWEVEDVGTTGVRGGRPGCAATPAQKQKK